MPVDSTHGLGNNIQPVKHLDKNCIGATCKQPKWIQTKGTREDMKWSWLEKPTIEGVNDQNPLQEIKKLDKVVASNLKKKCWSKPPAFSRQMALGMAPSIW